MKKSISNTNKKVTFGMLFLMASINNLMAQASLPELETGMKRIMDILDSAPTQAISVVVLMIIAITMIINRDSKRAVVGLGIVFGGIMLVKSAPSIMSYIWGS